MLEVLVRDQTAKPAEGPVDGFVNRTDGPSGGEAGTNDRPFAYYTRARTTSPRDDHQSQLPANGRRQESEELPRLGHPPGPRLPSTEVVMPDPRGAAYSPDFGGASTTRSGLRIKCGQP